MCDQIYTDLRITAWDSSEGAAPFPPGNAHINTHTSVTETGPNAMLFYKYTAW